MNDRVLCCVFNHNENEKAIAWWNRLSPYFETIVLDSGSDPACIHEGALNLENIFYSGLMNKAYELLCEKGKDWLMIITSDIEIKDAMVPALVEGMNDISRSVNVGLYQPCCKISLHGRSHLQSLCHFTGRLRNVNFQEGWFHLVRKDVLDGILPIDVNLNRLGWGIDLALCHQARVMKRLVLVDDRVKVIHPKGTGYNRDKALEQMRRWLATIPGYESPRHFRALKGKVRYE